MYIGLVTIHRVTTAQIKRQYEIYLPSIIKKNDNNMLYRGVQYRCCPD